MKKNNDPIVLCEYTKAEKCLALLLEESFRLYLTRMLTTDEPHAVSYER